LLHFYLIFWLSLFDHLKLVMSSHEQYENSLEYKNDNIDFIHHTKQVKIICTCFIWLQKYDFSSRTSQIQKQTHILSCVDLLKNRHAPNPGSSGSVHAYLRNQVQCLIDSAYRTRSRDGITWPQI
jgi:hypothetical protein